MSHRESQSSLLPTFDYVSIVKSLYKDRRGMVLGTLASVIGAAASAFKADAPILYFHAALLMMLLITRNRNMRAFEKANLDQSDIRAAYMWEKRAIFFGYFAAIAYGTWCFSAILLVRDTFTETVAITITVAAMVGIVTRNYGSDRLMTIQVIGMGGLMVLALFLVGDIYHITFGSLFLPMLLSFRSLGADVRNNLLNAVHEKVAASHLALQLDTALETMQHGLCMLDENGVIALVNDKAQDIFSGFAEGSWVGRTIDELLAESIEKNALPRSTAERILKIIAKKKTGKIVMVLSDNHHCEMSISSRDDRTVLLLEDVTSRVNAEERIRHMARYDSLTGLPNRGYFTEIINADLDTRRRFGHLPPAMMMIIDLDDFKHINDTLGHFIGDKVLSETAARMRAAMHPKSQLSRFGGDEFVLYRGAHTDRMNADQEARALIRSLSEPYFVDGQRIDLSATFGMADLSDTDTSFDAFFVRADLALARAKVKAKGSYLKYVEEMDGEFRYRQRLKADLRDAITNNKLSLVFQPIIDLSTRKMVSCEALARWNHPELGAISPQVFIGLAEDIGIISDITRWVLLTAAIECMSWPEEISVSVNVSGRDLRNDLLVQMVSQALKISKLNPERLEIEVTETALIEEKDIAAERLLALSDSGIRIALDDFGTGYSSLSYLNKMPFSKLKIDRSFIADIDKSARSYTLIESVARLGKGLDLILTAEGIETQAQLDAVIRTGHIDQVQGFFFGMPVVSSELRKQMGIELVDVKVTKSNRAAS